MYTGTLGASEAKTYHLKLWLDYDATVEQAANKVYQSKINVIANPEIQVVDNLEATFELNDKTLTSTLTNNVTSATYCTTTDNICTPNTSANISNNSYTVDLSSATPKTKQVATTLGNITVNVASSQMVCTTLNGTSKLICSNPEETRLVDFSKTSCTSKTYNGTARTCGEETVGIYEETTSKGTTYYYRGDVENNYLVFANKYWRIIRINEDGTVRIIYSGEKSEVDAAGKETVLANGYNDNDTNYLVTTLSGYGLGNRRSEYVGFTYTEGLQRPINTNSGDPSRIKTVLDDWYNNNLQVYDDMIVSTPGFCNDREMASGYSWSSEPSDEIHYAAYERLYVNNQPTFECSNSNDLYQTKIGLITADEVVFAGGNGRNSNRGYYLYVGEPHNFWTMTPSMFLSSGSVVFFGGRLLNPKGAYISYSFGVRPVINLSSDVTMTGTGTIQDPYVVL